MRSLVRYLTALLAVALLLSAALLAMAGVVTTEAFLLRAGSSAQVIRQQQERVDAAAEALEQAWQLSPAVLEEAREGAAQRYGALLAQWWGALWSDPDAETWIPMYLDAARERALVSAVMADEGFVAATAADQRRAIARDEVVYQLDEAVCDAVLPLRRSLVDMGLSLVTEQVSLPQLRRVALWAAAGAAVLGLLLLLAAHRAAGSALTATGLAMAAAGALVLLVDLPGMLSRLNPLAAEQAQGILLQAGACWYGTALVAVLAGLLVLKIKRGIRGRRDDVEMDQTL